MQHIQRQRDIFLKVIDNYGDIGFLTELLIQFRDETYIKYRIFTDNREKVENFLRTHKNFLPHYEVFLESEYDPKNQSDIIFLLFHYPIPKIREEKRVLILRIDYLSFDKKWLCSHETFHLESNHQKEIREIIPSPLPEGGGLLTPFPETYTKKSFSEKYHLEKFREKNWVSIFLYSPTFERCIFENQNLYLVLGQEPKTELPLNVVFLPFLPIPDYHALLSLTSWNMVRGEVSFVAALQSGVPFYWDMYKQIGGWNEEQSDDFLIFIDAGETYKQNHQLLNGDQGEISLSILERGLADMSIGAPNYDSLRETLKKHIDRFYFSL